MKKMMRFAAILAVTGSLGLTGCGGGERPAGGEGDLQGQVSIDGSSTVFPITEAVAEEFMAAEPGVRVTVGVSGTGGGFSKFLRGETDINDASRPIKPSEAQLAEQNNIEYIELPVAFDGIAVVANPANDWVECLTVEELRNIWEPGSNIDNWSQVREGFPSRPLNLFGAGTDSGTYDYFTEAIAGESGASRTDFSASEDDNVLVQGIAGDPNALGFFGLAYYEENAGRLKLLEVDGGDGCVAPDTETVGTGTYSPLARPIFIYVRSSAAEEPTVERFVEFYLENAGALADEVGYVALSDEAYELALERFRNRTAGSIYGEEGGHVGVTVEEMLRRGAGDTPATGPGAGPESEPGAQPGAEPAGPGTAPEADTAGAATQ